MYKKKILNNKILEIRAFYKTFTQYSWNVSLVLFDVKSILRELWFNRGKMKGTESALLICNLQLARKLTPVSGSSRISFKLGEVESSFRLIRDQTMSRKTRNAKSNWICRCCSRRLHALSTMFVIRYLAIDSQWNSFFFAISQESFPYSKNQKRNIDRKPPPSPIRDRFYRLSRRKLSMFIALVKCHINIHNFTRKFSLRDVCEDKMMPYKIQ